MGKKNILFVGAFNLKNHSNVFGGQIFACRSLIDSELKNNFDFTLIDSTQRSVPPPHLFIRIFDAFIRFTKFCYYTMIKKYDSCLIFCADGLSFVEKGLMIIISKYSGHKTLLFPVSGFVLNDVKSSFFKKFYKIVLDHTDILIAQGLTWKKFYENVNPNVNIMIQHNWIDDSNYHKSEYKNKDALQILFLGWVTKQKGIFDLIEVVDKLIRVDKFNIKLVIAGDGDCYDEISNLIIYKKLEEFVEMVGWISGSKKHKILNDSDIYVHPSYFEGYPNSLVEAMLTGLCTVSTTVGSIPDIIQNQVNGLLYNAGDKIHLYECLSQVIKDNNLRQKLGIQGYLTSKENNSLRSAIKNIGDIL